MDILNLAQGMVNGSGLPMQAEPIAGPKAVETSAQTPAAFNDALLNVINSLMVGQTKTTRDTTVRCRFHNAATMMTMRPPTRRRRAIPC